MKKLLLTLGLAAGLLGAAQPAAAALEADVVLIYGSSWRRVLPAYAAAATAPKKGEIAHLPPVILWSEGEERWTEELVRRLGPKRVAMIGPPGASAAELAIPGKVQRIEADDASVDSALAKAAFKGKAKVVYLHDGEKLSSALAAAALAAVDQAPLLIADGDLNAAANEAGALARRLGAESVVVVGAGNVPALAAATGRKVRLLSGEDALAEYNARVAGTRHLAVAAPADATGFFAPPKLSLLAVPYALGKKAALSWAGAGPGRGRSPEQAADALEATGAGPFDSVSIVGDYLAIPMQEIQDLDQVFKGDPTPRMHKLPAFVGMGAADRAVGRLAALDAYDLSRWVTRLLHDASARRDGSSALVLANAHEKFLLGETISRTTSAEMTNAGVDVHSYYREEIDAELIRKHLPGHGLVLWEGHPKDLTLDDDALPAPEAPLPPATFFLQGCYTLDRSDPFLLIERGANAVIGTYMAVYSASGSGFARAYLSSQLHEDATAGEAMAAARNYLLATVELKKRRGHGDWRKTLRAALSFDLWGDPTAPLPVKSGRTRKAPVSASVRGDQLTVKIPYTRLPEAAAGDYTANIRPGAQLSALYDYNPPATEKRLMELFFVEVDVPKELGDDPKVVGPYPAESYAWVFSPRTRKLSLLIHEQALPNRKQAATLKFKLSR